MGQYYVQSPSQETDLLKNMRRPDLYQWADEIGVEYRADAPAVLMRQIIRASGNLPGPERFNSDKKGNPTTYKRLARSKAPKSRHEAQHRAQAARERDKQWEKYMAMDFNDLRKIVKNQIGPKAIEDEPSREYMITRLVGPRIKTEMPETQPDAPERVPDEFLSMLSPPQLVKVARQLGIQECKIQDGKEVLLDKIRAVNG